MLLSLIGLVLCAKFDDSPQATVQGALNAFNKRDWVGFFSRFESAKPTEAAKFISEAFKSSLNIPTLNYKIGAFKISGNNATAPVTFIVQVPDAKDSLHAEDTAILKKTGNDWKIVSGGQQSMLFSQFAAIAKDPSKMKPAKVDAKEIFLLSNMKQLALAVIMHTQDHDETYAFTQAGLKKALNYYTKNYRTWMDADGKNLDIQINPNILGKKDSAFSSPSTTVMLTIGPKGKLVYKDGKTPVAFLDGHVKYIVPAGEKLLVWK